jgi:hypothetical protein
MGLGNGACARPFRLLLSATCALYLDYYQTTVVISFVVLVHPTFCCIACSSMVFVVIIIVGTATVTA